MNMGPKLQETLLQFAVMLFIEIAEEFAKDFPLCIREIGCVVILVDIAQIT